MLCRSHRRALVLGTSFLFAALAAAPAYAQQAYSKRAFAAPPNQVATSDDAPPPPDDVPPPHVEHHDTEPDETGGGVLFYGLGTFGAVNGLKLGVSDSGLELDPLKNKHFRLDGGASLYGGGFQVDIFGKYVRGGFATSVYGIDGARLKYDTLSNNFFVTAQQAWGATFDVFVGHEFLKGPIRPYVDLVGSISVVSVQVDLNHPEYGKLGRTDYEGWQFGFGPRAGFSVPLGKTAFFDLSGMYGVVGIEKVRVVGGIGFWSR
jgi:hypothetical protein